MTLPEGALSLERKKAELAERFKTAVNNGTPGISVDFKTFKPSERVFVAGLDFVPSHTVIVPGSDPDSGILCTTFALNPHGNLFRSNLVESPTGTKRHVRSLSLEESEAAVEFAEDPQRREKLAEAMRLTPSEQEELRIAS